MNKLRCVITAIICLTLLAIVSYKTDFWTRTPENRQVMVGFVYSEDESTPYTYNFVQAQRNLEVSHNGKVEVLSRSNVLAKECEEPLRDLIRRGCDIIFMNLDSNLPVRLAAEFPSVQFCQVSLPTFSVVNTPENYHTFNGEIYQARYASGVAAGMKLQQMLDSGEILPENAVVGYVGANDSTEVVSGYTAFFLGVRSVIPEATMRVRYTGTWSNYSLEKVRTRELIEEGCVIISHHTNTAAPAVVCEQASSEGYKVFFVGYHQTMRDVAPYTALLSIRTNWTPYIEGAVDAVMNKESIEKTVKGNLHGRDISAGFERDWVQLLEINQFSAAEGTVERLNRTVEGFQKGRIDVFRGDYIGINPENPDDMIDLKDGFTECRDSSQPSFRYILQDVITVEE